MAKERAIMSEFVDFNRRSITLPDGCKDLAEMLGRKMSEDEPPIVGWPNNLLWPTPRIKEIPVCNLPEVVRFLFQSGARTRSAIICTPEEREIVSLGWHKQRTELQAILYFSENPARAMEANKFLIELGKKSAPAKFMSPKAELLRPDELLNYDSFATNELELNVLLRRFFNEFLNSPPDAKLTCVVSGRHDDDKGVSGTTQN